MEGERARGTERSSGQGHIHGYVATLNPTELDVGVDSVSTVRIEK